MNRIMKILRILLCSFFLISCASARSDCPLAGKWKSNEKATLEQMARYGGEIPEAVRKMLSTNFFGRVAIEYTCSNMTSYYDGNETGKDMKYDILKEEGNLFEIRYHAPDLYGGLTTVPITLDGDCYCVPLNKHFAFSEVFCRVK